MISNEADLGCYADDLWLWYEITDLNRDTIIDVANLDLQHLMQWAACNLTTFETNKTYMMVVSNHDFPFDPTGVSMGGFAIKQVDQLKVTGFLFDSKLLCPPHINSVVRKARCRVGALMNLALYLNSSNMKAMYITFIRSILEHGAVLFMGARDYHLGKLDALQRSAQKLGGLRLNPCNLGEKLQLLVLYSSFFMVIADRISSSLRLTLYLGIILSMRMTHNTSYMASRYNH